MSACDIKITELESCKELPDTSEDDILVEATFDEAILNEISSVVDEMFDDSCTTSSYSATSSDFVRVRVRN